MAVRMAMIVSMIAVNTVWMVPNVINKLVNITEDVTRDISMQQRRVFSRVVYFRQFKK